MIIQIERELHDRNGLSWKVVIYSDSYISFTVAAFRMREDAELFISSLEFGKILEQIALCRPGDFSGIEEEIKIRINDD